VAVAERFPAQKLALFESHFCIRQFNGESDKEEEEEEAAAADDELYSTCEHYGSFEDDPNLLNVSIAQPAYFILSDLLLAN
jgi:hypothetical protein